ncbi:hypothetical protein D1AOALGA4SA_12692 [Olavius algarvensis Delta 1 endosymbiont]|nr:hypothetical protein D1AOALGA4SA_12692 [Olavius algarvensis Delta 1 endosymbiont]
MNRGWLRRVNLAFLFYFVAENQVLWAWSEPFGYAVNLL